MSTRNAYGLAQEDYAYGSDGFGYKGLLYEGNELDPLTGTTLITTIDNRAFMLSHQTNVLNQQVYKLSEFLDKELNYDSRLNILTNGRESKRIKGTIETRLLPHDEQFNEVGEMFESKILLSNSMTNSTTVTITGRTNNSDTGTYIEGTP